MNREYKLKDLFQYRNVWMGFAILWIIVYHSELPVDNRLLWMIKNVGYCGVDIFFFASGLGCFYSFTKNPDAWAFLRKRISRIIPTYWVFLTILYLFEWNQGILRPQYILSNYLCTEYFLDSTLDTAFNWYMGAVWVMYLLVPFFWKAIRKMKHRSLCLIPVLLLISAGFWHSDNLILTATRVPVFFLGMYFEYLALEEESLTKKRLIRLFVLFLAGFFILVPMRLLIIDNTIMWGCGFLFYPFLLMTPFICISISLFCLIPGKVTAVISRSLDKAGNYSFELYLMHHFVFETGYYILLGASFFKTRRYWVLLYLIVYPSAVLLRVLTSKIMELIAHLHPETG